MAEKEFFKHALSDFVFDAAGGGAIRHLAGQGLTVRQIAERLDFPIPYERIRQMAWEAMVAQEIVLLEEPGTGKQVEKAVYIKEQGEFGKTSFRRVVISKADCRPIPWAEEEYGKNDQAEFEGRLSEAYVENGREAAYASCDFGLWQAKDQKQYVALLKMLDGKQREYIEGLPWPRQRVYHRLDARFSEILNRLLSGKQYTGCCYFLGTGKKLILK